MSIRFIIAIIMFLSALSIYPQNNKENSFKIVPYDSLKLKDEGKEIFLVNCENYQVDFKGNIFVNDRANYQVLKYSPKGELIKKIGRKGNGPGEFETGYHMDLTPSGEIFMYDGFNQKLMLFSNDGKYTYKKMLNKDYQLWLNSDFINETKLFTVVMLEKPIKKNNAIYFEYKMAIIDLNNFNTIFLGESIISSLSDRSQSFTNVVSSASRIFYGYGNTSDYKVFVYNTDGKIIKEIKKDSDKIKMTGKNRDEYEKGMEQRKKIMNQKLGLKKYEDQPPYYDIISCLALDGFENLWVFTNKGRNENKLHVDLYDKNGNYKKSFYLENNYLGNQKTNKIILKDGFMYAYQANGDSGGNVYKYVIPKAIYSN